MTPEAKSPSGSYAIVGKSFVYILFFRADQLPFSPFQLWLNHLNNIDIESSGETVESK